MKRCWDDLLDQMFICKTIEMGSCADYYMCSVSNYSTCTEIDEANNNGK